ncbi:hypothetical protein HA51_01885 [Pantoea rwandensis]|uniref:Uncharacterized protein n=1 Tax=Pantoea rwandensis TaxID=1076550 RepID=A0A1X1D5I5_9GAMM|nr:hypothetical protein HA51_01885 [Pantoea rwandensis]
MSMISRLLGLDEVITFKGPMWQGVSATLLLLIICRIAINIREAVHIMGLRLRRRRDYTVRVWRAHPADVLLLLFIESVVVIIVGALTLVILESASI